ncbi:MAG: hypothetical protein J7K14_01505 [Sulfurimonas sp.]|nr:hypothetical protein [Sulfurimonas sp.]
MADSLKGKFFVASREMYGDNSVKYSNLDLLLTNENYDDSGNGFDWGDSGSGSKLLASAMLKKIGTPTIARIYANKYAQSVLKNFTQDNWRLEAIEVAKWINSNTDYNVAIDEINEEEIQAKKEEAKRLEHKKELEALAKEERRIEREKEFQQKIKNKLQEREITAKKEQEEHEKREIEEEKERLKVIESLEAGAQLAAKAQEYKTKAIKYQNELKKYKLKLNKYQNELDTCKLEMERNREILDEKKVEILKYKELIKLLDIPSLHKMFNNLSKS